MSAPSRIWTVESGEPLKLSPNKVGMTWCLDRLQNDLSKKARTLAIFQAVPLYYAALATKHDEKMTVSERNAAAAKTYEYTASVFLKWLQEQHSFRSPSWLTLHALGQTTLSTRGEREARYYDTKKDSTWNRYLEIQRKIRAEWIPWVDDYLASTQLSRGSPPSVSQENDMWHQLHMFLFNQTRSSTRRMKREEYLIRKNAGEVMEIIEQAPPPTGTQAQAETRIGKGMASEQEEGTSADTLQAAEAMGAMCATRANLENCPAEANGSGAVNDEIEQGRTDRTDLEEDRNDLKQGRKDLEQGRKSLGHVGQVGQGQEDFEEDRNDLEEGRKDLGQGQKDLEEGRNDLEQGRKDLEQGRKDLEQGRKDLEQGQENLEHGRKDLKQGRKDLEEEVIVRVAMPNSWLHTFSLVFACFGPFSEHPDPDLSLSPADGPPCATPNHGAANAKDSDANSDAGSQSSRTSKKSSDKPLRGSGCADEAQSQGALKKQKRQETREARTAEIVAQLSNANYASDKQVIAALKEVARELRNSNFHRARSIALKEKEIRVVWLQREVEVLTEAGDDEGVRIARKKLLTAIRTPIAHEVPSQGNSGGGNDNAWPAVRRGDVDNSRASGERAGRNRRPPTRDGPPNGGVVGGAGERINDLPDQVVGGQASGGGSNGLAEVIDVGDGED